MTKRLCHAFLEVQAGSSKESLPQNLTRRVENEKSPQEVLRARGML
jgi:hypothetical protein